MSNRNTKTTAKAEQAPMPIDVLFGELTEYVIRLQTEAMEARAKGRTNETYLEDAFVYDWAADKLREHIDGLKSMRDFMR